MLGCVPSLLLSATITFSLSEGVVSSHPQVSAFPSSCLVSSNVGYNDAITEVSLMQKASGRNQILANLPTSGSSNESMLSSWSTSWNASLRKHDIGLSVSFLQTRHTISTLALFVAVAALSIGIAKMLVDAWAKSPSSEHDFEEEAHSDSSMNVDENELAMDGTCSIGFHERSHYDSDSVVKYINKHHNSWCLLFKVMGALVRFWGLLAIMEFALLQDTNALMDCDAPKLGSAVRHMCKYTKACLHSYPILCANMTLVLMVRVLVQMQLYYSMLKRKCVVDFVSVHILRTPWPWICAFSMLQGGLHFLLKTYMDVREVNLHFFQTCAAAGYKFIIPGIMFLSFFPHYTEVENMLVPLNRIVENDYTRLNRKCPWLSELEVVNERVLAKDVRGVDIFERSRSLVHKELLTIDDIVDNILDNYESVHTGWLATKHSREGRQGKWVFKAMWPVGVLLHTRMDRQNTETRQWMYVLGIMLSGSVAASVLSLFILFWFCDPNASLVGIPLWRDLLYGRWETLRTDAIIANMVLACHGVIVCFFLYRTIWGMFYQRLYQIWSRTDIGALGIMIAVFFVFGFVAKEMI